MARKIKSKTNASPEVPDVTRDAESAENFLGPSQTLEKPAPKREGAKKPADQAHAAAKPLRSGDDASRSKEAIETRAMPSSIREKFIGVGSDYFFPDGAVAFRDHGTHLTTPSGNTEVIRSLVEIAQARQWNDITVRGTERFRKEAWFAASLAGIGVKGYEPTQFERQHMIRAIARRDGYTQEGAPENDVAIRGDGAPSREVRTRLAGGIGADSHASNDGDRLRADGPDGAAPTRRVIESATFTGRLVDHGAAPYHHDRKEAMSYFVRLETPTGDKEIWGVDLERAINKSLTRPTMGDQVTVKAVGRDPVTVLVEKHDDEGRVVDTQEVQTHRNRWAVEQAAFLAQRAAAAKVFRDSAITPEDGVKRHPELKGTYLQLQVAKDFAERDISQPTDRRRFIDGTREALAAAIEGGEALQPVQMKDRGRESVERQKRPDRDMEPMR